MTNAKWASADANGGWANHFAQMQRWSTRAIDALKNGENIESLDFSLAFFLWCYSLRDWLLKDGMRTKEDLERLLSGNQHWKYCRDVVLRTKHFDPSNPSVDADFGISREYDWFSAQFRGVERSDWNLWIDGKKLKLPSLINDLSEMWKQELREELEAKTL